MNSLQGYFAAERKSKTSGAGANDVCKVRWQFYESLTFLADNINPRRTESNVASQGQVDGALKIAQNMPIQCKTLLHQNREKRLLTNELLETAINVLKRPRPAAVLENVEERTADKVFSELVWKMLQEIPDGVTKDMVKIDIKRQPLHANHSSLQIQELATQ
eukprot:gene4924-5571_t